MQKRVLASQTGSLAVMMIGLILVSIFIYAVTALLQSTRQQVTHNSQIESRKILIDRTLGLMRNSYIFNYSLANHNSSSKNPKLKDCMTSAHFEAAACKNVPIEFYQPSPVAGGADVKFAGPSSSPFYSDMNGASCVDGEGKPTSRCAFMVTSSCKFECLVGKTYCPLAKIVSCDLEVTGYGQNYFRDFVFSKKNPTFANQFAVKITNDLESFFVEY